MRPPFSAGSPGVGAQALSTGWCSAEPVARDAVPVASPPGPVSTAQPRHWRGRQLCVWWMTLSNRSNPRTGPQRCAALSDWPVSGVESAGHFEDGDAGPKTEFVHLVWRRCAGCHVLGDLPDINAQASKLGQHPARPRLIRRVLDGCALYYVIGDIGVGEERRAVLDEEAKAARQHPGSLRQREAVGDLGRRRGRRVAEHFEPPINLLDRVQRPVGPISHSFDREPAGRGPPADEHPTALVGVDQPLRPQETDRLPDRSPRAAVAADKFGLGWQGASRGEVAAQDLGAEIVGDPLVDRARIGGIDRGATSTLPWFGASGSLTTLSS
jgi:hypothetical protein